MADYTLYELDGTDVTVTLSETDPDRIYGSTATHRKVYEKVAASTYRLYREEAWAGTPELTAGTYAAGFDVEPTAAVTGDGTGDVVGPASATDNAVARFDTTTGKLVQNSVVTIADTSGNVAGVGNLTATSATVNGAAADAVHVAVRGHASQTADIFQVQTSANALLMGVEDDGSVNIATGATFKINGTAHTHANTEITGLVEATTLQLKIIDDATALTTGDGKLIFVIPLELNGYNLTDADAFATTVSSSGTPTVQVRNVTDAVDMLSTRITIDANEATSYTAATAPVIDTTKDDVATGDLLAIDVDVAGTGAKGLGVVLTFTKP